MRQKHLLKQISEKSVEVKMKSGKDGKTFGSISTKEIATGGQRTVGL